MTEREIPEVSGFLFGGKTDTSSFAPLAASGPENLMIEDFSTDVAPTGTTPAAPATAVTATPDVAAPVYRSRREMRAAGGYAAPVLPELIEPTAAPTLADENLGGIASLFPLLGEVASAVPAAAAPELTPNEPKPSEPKPSEPKVVAAPTVLPATVAEPVQTVAEPVVITTSSISVITSSIPVLPAVQAPATPAPAVEVPAIPAPDATQAMDISENFGFITDTPIPATAAPTAAPESAAPDAMPSRRSLRAEPTVIREPRPAKRRAKRDRLTGAGGRPKVRPNSAGALDRKTIGQRITGLGVMVLIGGLFTVLALPAYADNDASSLTAAAKLGAAQKLQMTAASADVTATISRDGYTATSAAALKSMYASGLRAQNLNAYLQSGAKAQGDDYPWYAELSRNQGGGLSPLNYYYRECVDFVAWRLNRDAGSTSAPFKYTWSTLTPNGGNASQWKSAWLAHGWPTGTTPKVGAVAWFNYNHVAYVSGILTDGSVLIEEYNQQGDHLYNTRIIQPGDAYYLYAPPA